MVREDASRLPSKAALVALNLNTYGALRPRTTNAEKANWSEG